MKILKTYQQLFESKSFTPSKFDHFEWPEFDKYIKELERDMGKKVEWRLDKDQKWKSFIKPGMEFLVLPLDGQRLIGVKIDRLGKIQRIFDEEGQDIPLDPTIEDMIKKLQNESKNVRPEVVELISDLLVPFSDSGYKIDSKWEIYIGNSFAVEIKSTYCKELLLRGSQLAQIIEQLLSYIEDTEYVFHKVSFDGWIDEKLMTYIIRENSYNSQHIFSEIICFQKKPISSREDSCKNLPEGEFDVLDFLTDTNYPIQSTTLVFKSKFKNN